VMERARGILRRERTRDRVADLALWAGLSCFVLLKGGSGEDSSWSVALLGVPLLAVGVLVCRAFPPVPLLLVVVASAALDPQLFTTSYVVAMVAFGWLAGRRMEHAGPALYLLAGTVAGGLVLTFAVGDDLWTFFTFLTTLLLAVVLPWLVGRYVRQYAELVGAGWQLADRMEREQRAVADRERLRERSRIAGDMHDSLGHELSLIAVRAAALQVDPALGARQRAAAGELREAAADATARLRDIIGVLRADGESAPATPVDETVSALVERAGGSGMAVELTDEGPEAPLAPMTGLALHRVVQESLTNAARHAPGAAVAVRLVREEQRVTVTVTDSGRPPGTSPAPDPDPGPARASGGTGLVGLDERVRLAGGALTHGPSGDGFAVRARLPLSGERLPVPSTHSRDAEAPTSARELDRARRRVRRGLKQTIVVPLAALAVLVALMSGFQFYGQTRSVLDRAQFDRIRVGDSRADVQTRLPSRAMDGPPDGVGPEPSGVGRCDYYRTRKYAATPAYRLCFRTDRLTDKAIVTDVDNEEDR
jgi:signal transduction histidine kinase